ncbi:CpaF family protein [Actinokineospora inagensis]|uniref:CpaF family protein n=1 Tax=Actinokineospora inagensis TaxID=103730 RepID=UPI0004210F07|nr:ATPase, T2SS/T4P/T4SS family [Actinokineospora inagensis]
MTETTTFTRAGIEPGSEVEAIGRMRESLRLAVAAQLGDRVSADDAAGRTPMTPPERRALAAVLVQEAADAYANGELERGGTLLSPEVEARVTAAVVDDLVGMGGLQPLLDDESIENINVNGDRVFVRYADGRRARLAPVVPTDSDLIDLIRDLAARSGMEERRFDRGSPIVNFRLPDGARVSAVMSVTERPSVSIRRHRYSTVTLAELREMGTLDVALESFFAAAVRARRNILVAGGTAIGKTTMLRGLASAIPPEERLITIEDVAELGFGDDEHAHPDVVALQAREANIEGQGAVSLADLVWQALRMSPDRVIVGEVRGREVIPLTNAMSQGNDGSMGTIHASSSKGVFTKLAAYAVQSPERLDIHQTNILIASALHLVVFLDKPRGEPHRRVVSSIREVVDAEGSQVVSNEIWRPGSDRRAVPGAPIRTETMELLVDAGFEPDLLDNPDGWWQP